MATEWRPDPRPRGCTVGTVGGKPDPLEAGPAEPFQATRAQNV